jgi:transposase-like protein
MELKVENPRQIRGKAIYEADNQIKRLGSETYKVKSQNGNGEYDVIKTGSEWMCSCPDHTYRHVKCKHIWAVEFSQAIRKTVEPKRKIQGLDLHSCRYCGSENLVKRGIRHNKYGDVQRYLCKDCGKKFSFNIGFEKMKATPQVITSAMQLYFTGTSYRNVSKFLRLQGVKVSHVAVYNWVTKYIGLMDNYLENIKPEVGDTWRADEVWVKVKGDKKYLFALMDDETRFWIAQEVADSKFKHDAQNLFKMGKDATGKSPKKIITDGLPSYHDAYKKEFWTLKKETRAEHIRHIKLQGDHNNNMMERLNGEFRDREKVMRGLKKKDSPSITGYQLYHNYLREHEGLKGKTPAEACGIEIEGENKWITIIQNASKSIQ